MGAGIAQLTSMAGYPTLLYDTNEEQLDKARSAIHRNLSQGIDKGKVTQEEKDRAFENLMPVIEFDDLRADLFIEAIVEQLDPKVALFQKLAEQNEANTILATNTSSIPISRIAAQIPNPERVAGMHFFNPAHIMKLVEVIAGAATHTDVVETLSSLAQELGKQPVQAKDAPGFIVNRVARHFYVESLQILEECVASHEDIDTLIEATGFKMGPFRLMDLIGVDTNFSVTNRMFESFHYDSKFRPSRTQQQKVDAGHHGRKTKKGFYEY